MAQVIDPRLKQIKIKAAVVKRIIKEKESYEKEADMQRQRIEKMRNENKDSYDIKKQEEVLQEAVMMVPDCMRRLASGVEDLKNILNADRDLFAENEDFKAAEEIVSQAEKVH